MAKHLVKCFYCGEIFDAAKEPFIMANSRRYAHVECAKQHEAQLTEEDKARIELEKYVKQLLNISSITPKIKKQIEKYITENQYTYSGIHRSLIYFYEIKKNDISKANGGLGIVPYVYQEAYNYYYNIWLAQQTNENKNLEQYKPKEVIITITPPKRRIKKRKLFKFLDEEADSE